LVILKYQSQSFDSLDKRKGRDLILQEHHGLSECNEFEVQDGNLVGDLGSLNYSLKDVMLSRFSNGNGWPKTI